MNFTVTYRARDGRLAREDFEAEGRGPLFATLAQRGISAVKVEEGAPARRKRRIPAKGLAAALVAVAVAVAALWLVFRREAGTNEAEDATKTSGLIPSAQPSVAKPDGAKTGPAVEAAAKPKAPPYPIHVDEAGVRRYPNGVRVFDEKTPMRPPTTPFGDKPIFGNKCLNELSSFINLRPGETLFGTRKYDARYLENLKKGLDEKIEISDEDDEKTRAAKLEMKELQAELRRMSDKEILSMVQDTYSELQRLARYKADVQAMVKKATAEKDDLTEKDYADIIEVANQMLAKEGIAPIRNTYLIRRNIRHNNLDKPKPEPKEPEPKEEEGKQ